MDRGPVNFLAVLDGAKLTPRYLATLMLIGIQEIFEYFDFFIIGYLMAVLAPQWKLNFGESSLILVGAGMGSILGSAIAGWIADRVGRKPVLVISIFLYSISAGLVTLIPDGAWLLFAALRFLIGLGSAAAVTVQVALLVEITPTRYRTFLTSVMITPVSLGIMLAALSSSMLFHLIGWRGIAGLGASPVVLGVLTLLVVPESARWLVSRGKLAQAREAAAKQLGVPAQSLPMPEPEYKASEQTSIASVLSDRGRFFWVVITWLGLSTTTYGIQLWGPTILALSLNLPLDRVAAYFVSISLVGTIGRLAFSAIPVWVGRRRAAQLMAFGTAAAIAVGGLCFRIWWGPVPVFVVCLNVTAFFLSGGFANITPYVAEAFPVRLAGRAMGLAQSVNGLGKIFGPMCLAVIAGTGDLVTPKATAAAVQPAFLFLAACAAVAGIAYVAFRRETNGVPLELDR
ncbi:UNVERIFIED_ORG: putative MFS transporter [Paraburkholderia sediminicola]|nr:putative MFS transporter [Paraburkholderia sediminicola]